MSKSPINPPLQADRKIPLNQFIRICRRNPNDSARFNQREPFIAKLTNGFYMKSKKGLNFCQAFVQPCGCYWLNTLLVRIATNLIFIIRVGVNVIPNFLFQFGDSHHQFFLRAGQINLAAQLFRQRFQACNQFFFVHVVITLQKRKWPRGAMVMITPA
ncbi:hypothetical protein ABW06_24465 [Pluralibacter gergoviae]|uniref:Uncharacterized protein n=1 Tax=Pluralibacter gergoviae TaxID=61647 RepID=A0A0F0VCQ5_PLUGE|nr:hypothetical protein SS31_20770 [Pluralibacter gergoviae]KMK08705.1 hypothetical protein ABW06_24465 [Pluralibacter gergoviae]KMK25708.1 hypothetical protein ABW10_06905 [Pluralibacter gergoviae]